ncbi:MAG: hypothetical protein K2J39_12455 [Ruminococcus sp.]|nr:hypothetical protein [Ruminococcus sp.]
MQKEKATRIMEIISTIIFGISILISCIFVIFSKYIVIDPLANPQSSQIFYVEFIPFMLIIALLPLSLFILTLINALSKKVSYNRGIVTVILTFIFNISNKDIAEIIINKNTTMLSLISKPYTASQVYLIYNRISQIQQRMNFYAIILFVSALSVEIYMSKRLTAQKIEENNDEKIQ